LPIFINQFLQEFFRTFFKLSFIEFFLNLLHLPSNKLYTKSACKLIYLLITLDQFANCLLTRLLSLPHIFRYCVPVSLFIENLLLHKVTLIIL
jgi:hypothetical protein